MDAAGRPSDPKERAARLRAVVASQNEIAACGLGLAAVMELVVRRAQQLTGAAAAVVELAEGNEMVTVAASGTAEGRIGDRVPLDAGLSGACLRVEEAVHCENAETDHRVDFETSRELGAISVLCVPLREGDSVTGVLKAYSPRAFHFGEDDVETLELLSEVVAAHRRLAPAGAEDNEARRDELTGLANRRSYDERLIVEADRARRYGRPLGLCMLEVDGLDAVTERGGQAAANEVLRTVAGILDNSRTSDEAFRIGGDEFALLMPETGPAQATTAAERLARAVSEAGLGEGVSVLYGVASNSGDPSSLHQAARAALGEAKSALERG
jgi:diguanylate cyclase (GGDEF)-like protein